MADYPELRAILVHNRDEEIEHAAMILEWLRRSGGAWDEELRTYLFTEEPIAESIAAVMDNPVNWKDVEERSERLISA